MVNDGSIMVGKDWNSLVTDGWQGLVGKDWWLMVDGSLDQQRLRVDDHFGG